MVAAGVLLLGALATTNAPLAWGQEELHRKVKTKVAADYPELARRMNITGMVRILVTVLPNGSVKNAKIVGGHPLLAASALDAIKKWRFEASTEESTGIVEIRFDPGQ
jgi:protein TonB